MEKVPVIFKSGLELAYQVTQLFCKEGLGRHDVGHHVGIICGTVELSKTLSLYIFYPNIGVYNSSVSKRLLWVFL